MLLTSPPRELANRLVRENTNGWTCIWYDSAGNEKGRAGYADAGSKEEAQALFDKDHSDFNASGYKMEWYGPMDQLPPPGTKNDRTS